MEFVDIICQLPDYLNDLNACHEMERILNQDQYENYCGWLYRGKWEHEKHEDWKCDFPIYISSPAYVRCEAFLRVIGKWEE